MAFNTLNFVLFLSLVIIVYFVIGHKFRVPFMLLASYFFYAYYDIPLIIFLIFITLFNYGVTLMIDKGEYKKVWLYIGLIGNVGVLAFYKYLNFSFRILNSIFSKIGFGGKLPQFSFLVPLGISFIVFSVISYIVDVYKGKIKVEKNLFKFALYVSFFPKVVQGPIVKARDMLDQFDEKHHFNMQRFREGALMVMWGMFMKMVLADRIAIPVNLVYGSIDTFAGTSLIIATFLFALQLYFDFAGYSLIAIGIFKILGFRVNANFKQPYLSTSVGEFWRRWHISLNEWLMEYIYIPLGGSRVSNSKYIFNVLFTFGLSGLWHGSNGGYIVWGLLNGLFILAEKYILTKKASNKSDIRVNPIPTFLNRVKVFVLISITWIFFRAATTSASIKVISNMINKLNFKPTIDYILSFIAGDNGVFLGLNHHAWMVIIIALILTIIVDLLIQKYDLIDKVANAPLWIRWPIFVAIMIIIIIYGLYGFGYDASNFIYSQF